MCDFTTDISPCGSTMTAASSTIKLTSCTKNIDTYLVQHGISSSKNWGTSSGITEYGLILNRAGKFSISSNEIERLQICQNHRRTLSTKWPGVWRQTCSFPDHQGKKNAMKNPRRVSEHLSNAFFNKKQTVLPIGSALCSRCRDSIYAMVGQTDEQTRHKTTVLTEVAHGSEYADPLDSPEIYDSSGDDNPADKSMWEDSMSQQQKNRESLNAAIQEISEGRCSPVQSTLNTQWQEISEKQKEYYVRKAKDSIAAVFGTLAPGQENELWKSVMETPDMFDETSGKNRLWDHPTVQALVAAYNSASTSQTRKQVLSVFADDFTIRELQDMIPGLSRWRITQARAHAANTGKGQPLESKHAYRSRLDKVQTDHFLEFVSRPEYLHDVAFGTTRLHLESGETITIPSAIRTLIPARLIQQYQHYCAATGFKPLSASSLFKILKACAASQQKSLEGLDYITSDGAKAFDDLSQIADILAANGQGLQLINKIKSNLKSSKRYLKTDYRVHISSDSACPDHCITFALNDTTNDKFRNECNHNHTLSCDRCDQLRQILENLQTMITSPTSRLTSQQTASLLFDLEKSSNDINDWKCHILRTVHQDLAKQTALRSLDSSSVVVVMDWAMKFLPRRYRETMADFFGKKGKSWHVTAIVFADQGSFSVECIAHVFETCIQNWYAVASILEHVLKVIKSENPNVKIAYLKSDNAGCYHSASLLQSLHGISQRSGVNVARYDFSDPQSGKDVCDRKIAPMKAQIRRYIDEKHDVLTASDMKKAIESHNGIAGVRVTVAEVDTTTSEKRETKWEGISFLNNFRFEKEGIRAWRAFEVGQGVVYPYKANVDEDDLDTGLIIIEDMDQRQHGGFYKSPDQVAPQNNSIFTCTEASCVSSFSSEAKLHRHLDTGKHDEHLERESTYDTLKKQWAKIVTGITTAASDSNTMNNQDTLTNPISNTECVDQGWGLRKMRKNTRMTSAVKYFLTAVFNEGVETGIKATPANVAQQMKHKTKENGDPFFEPTDWKTEKQIRSFFTRLAAKQRKRNVDTVDEDDVNAFVEEEQWQATRAEVYEALDIGHPVTYQDIDICQCVKDNKHNELKLRDLKEICDKYHLQTNGPKNRKYTFLEPIVELVNTCACNTH